MNRRLEFHKFRRRHPANRRPNVPDWHFSAVPTAPSKGIRGRANVAITPELALRVGQAAGLIFRRGGYRNRVLTGKDTRRSGYMIETALVAGFTSMGMDVLLTRPIPTPAVGMLTRSMRADLGVTRAKKFGTS